jgi:Tryptophan-associated transmembrane protein (Trp_oprn_chp)
MTFLRSRRGFVLVVVACAVASAVVLFAASRTWSHVVTQRPAPFPPITARRTGASLEPWLPALGIVGLAGAGALVALRGRLRALLGILLILVGLATAVLSLTTASLWPAVCAAGGVLIALAGLATATNHKAWPAMGARYERPSAKTERKPVSQAELWDALDRGEDPTT